MVYSIFDIIYGSINYDNICKIDDSWSVREHSSMLVLWYIGAGHLGEETRTCLSPGVTSFSNSQQHSSVLMLLSIGARHLGEETRTCLAPEVTSFSNSWFAPVISPYSQWCLCSSICYLLRIKFFPTFCWSMHCWTLSYCHVVLRLHYLLLAAAFAIRWECFALFSASCCSTSLL